MCRSIWCFKPPKATHEHLTVRQPTSIWTSSILGVCPGRDAEASNWSTHKFVSNCNECGHCLPLNIYFFILRGFFYFLYYIIYFLFFCWWWFCTFSFLRGRLIDTQNFCSVKRSRVYLNANLSTWNWFCLLLTHNQNLF